MLEQSRDQLAAAIILESAKTWSEADGDVCEAIDFCRFYARWALEYGAPLVVALLLTEVVPRREMKRDGAIFSRGMPASRMPEQIGA